MKTDKFFYICIILFSAIFIWLGNFLVAQNISIESEREVVSARVTNIVERNKDLHETGGGLIFTNLFIIFEAYYNGEIVTGEFSSFGTPENIQREIRVGDRVILSFSGLTNRFLFIEYERINYIIVLAFFLGLIFIVLGRMKGIAAIVALIITCLAIFLVLVPAILSGRNIYVVSIAVTIFSIGTTLAIVAGKTKKSLAAFIGCISGVFLASIIMYSMDIFLNLTGLIDTETRSLVYFQTDYAINIRAVIFAGVIIGASGAITDVAMSISSALWEVQKNNTTKKELFKSGIEIGKDILGTMLNTLILAYIGTSLSLILLIQSHTTSFLELFNTEMIIVELLRSIVGSFGMLAAVPVTALICSIFYNEKNSEKIKP